MPRSRGSLLRRQRLPWRQRLAPLPLRGADCVGAVWRLAFRATVTSARIGVFCDSSVALRELRDPGGHSAPTTPNAKRQT